MAPVSAALVEPTTLPTDPATHAANDNASVAGGVADVVAHQSDPWTTTTTTSTTSRPSTSSRQHDVAGAGSGPGPPDSPDDNNRTPVTPGKSTTPPLSLGALANATASTTTIGSSMAAGATSLIPTSMMTKHETEAKPNTDPVTAESMPLAQCVYLQFPRALESALAPYDDPPIVFAQRLWSSACVRIAVLAVTVVTAVEAALPLPAALYALGYDAHAGLATSVLIVLALTSQLPKKFIFRPRPWVAGRAVSFRKDTTSSFPSRAVVCSVVFSWLAITCLQLDPSEWARAAMGSTSLTQSMYVWGVVGLSAVLAAFARIIVGAHYPSDTVCGFFLGLVVIRLGVHLEQLWPYLGCLAVAPASNHFAIASHGALTLSSSELVGHASQVLSSTVVISLRSLLYLTPHTRLIGAAAVSYLLTIVSIKGFWVKCSYVYGLLLSAATFRLVFLSPMTTGVAVEALSTHGGLWQHVAASAVFGGWLAFGMSTRAMKGNVRTALFTIIYFGVLFSILLFRL